MSIMTPNPISVKIAHKISDVQLLFTEYNIHHLPVVDQDVLVGIISKLDVEKLASMTLVDPEGYDLLLINDMPVSQIMTKQVEYVQIYDEIKTAAKILAKGEFHCFPVLEQSSLKGIVTSTDIIKYAVDLL